MGGVPSSRGVTRWAENREAQSSQRGRSTSAQTTRRSSIILAEGVRLFAFNIDGPHDMAPRSIKHRNDDLGASGAKRGQITGIGCDVYNIDDLPLRHSCAGKSLREWEGGMFRRAGAAPGNVPYDSCRVIYVIKTDPAVVARAP
jgi:hypothetical protein